MKSATFRAIRARGEFGALLRTCVLIVLASASIARAQASGADESAASLRRIVKTFDFDERPDGNYETLPMNWLPIVREGYPRFLEPAFDMESGHDAAPSLHMNIRTGNVGARYLAKDIPAHPGSEYRISAWVRTERLEHAGAIVSAHYLDHALQPIDGTEYDSAPVNAKVGGEQWTRVIVNLPGGVENARWIGLTCKIEQPASSGGGDQAFISIPSRDTVGGAWFDDIVVIRRPRVRMRLNDETHVYFEGDAVSATISLLDLDGAGLGVSLDVFDAEGVRRQSFQLNGPDLLNDGRSIALHVLPPGLYTARLDMRLDRHRIASHERRFAVLRRPDAGPMGSRVGFGINLSAKSFGRVESIELVRKIRPWAVKAPLFRAGLTDEAAVFGDPQIRSVLASLRESGIDVVAVLDSLPAGIAGSYKLQDRTVDRALAQSITKNSEWVSYLRLLLMRHGAWTDAWQLGGDDCAGTFDADSVGRAVANLRRIINPLVGQPRIIVPVASQDALQSAPGDVIARSFAFHVSPATTANDKGRRAGAVEAVEWATVSLGDEDEYERIPRLAQFARGLVSARAAGFEAVFTPPLCDDQATDDGPVIRPREELLLFEAASRRLGGYSHGTRLTLHPDVETWLFERPDSTRGVVVAWSAIGDDVMLSLDIDEATEIDDAWGRALEVKVSRRGLRIPIGEMPVYMRGVDSRRIRALDSFAVDNDVLLASIQSQSRTLTFQNTFDDDLVGSLNLQAPSGWRVTPRKFDLRLKPGEVLEAVVELKPRTNSPAGLYEITGQVEASGDAPLHATMMVRVDAPGLDVNVFAHRDGDGIRFVQRVTNTAQTVMRLKSYLVAPGRPRETQVINSLGAGETAFREYRLSPASALAGEYVRVTVEQIDGDLKHNTVIKLSDALGRP